MRLNIPKLKTDLTVAKNFKATIHCENRNMKFLHSQGLVPDPNQYWIHYCNKCKTDVFGECPGCKSRAWNTLATRQYTIPKGATLIIDRYYIRNGSEDFDSVTFRIHHGKLKGRFWLKLDDASQIDFV